VRPRVSAEQLAELPDFRRLPEPVDLTTVVETSDADPAVHLPDPVFATEDLEAMARTNALGG
jgi:hypothetical protein